MITLTKNRIIEAGDEYRNNGEWKPVPASIVGLQVMFTTYEEVRRPSATPPPTALHPSVVELMNPAIVKRDNIVATKPISPDSEKPETRPLAVGNANAKRGEGSSAIVPAKAESEQKASVPTHSGTEAMPHPDLPTVISAKAHKHILTPKELRSVVAKIVGIAIEHETCIKFPDPHATKRRQTQWIGRNGTFNQTGLTMIHGSAGLNKGIIKMIPTGKRGVARNALIEFPVEAIPQIIAFLEKHKLPERAKYA